MSELNSHLAAYTFHIFHYFSWRVREKVREGGKHPHYYPSAVSKSPLDCCSTTKKLKLMRKRRKNCMNTGCSDPKLSKVNDFSTETVHK